MDYRTALSPNSELRFSADIKYTIRGEVGRGGSCIVYDGFYRTNAGDEKTVRIKECYPYELNLARNKDNSLICLPEQTEKFEKKKAQMYSDFRLCNTLFYAEEASDAIINTLNIHEANNTVYTVSTWSRENALPNIEITGLRHCLSIVRQTAAAIRSIHESGYLYLDIKPENISVINSSSGRVQLFDFDSLIPITQKQENNAFEGYRLSYTKGFAALELRKGQLNKLGPHTDVYGIGALLFTLLFSCTPEAPDCARTAAYDFSRIRFSGNYPDKIFIALTDFFHCTLAGFIPDRCQTMDQAVRDLEAIEKLADPAYPYLISTSISAPDWIIGRQNERKTLDEWCREPSKHSLFISGMGGIGKSTFVRDYLSQHRNDWDSIVYLYFKSSLCQTILNDDMLRINGTERYPEEKEADYFDRKLRKFREIAQGNRILLIFDNFENEQDPDLAAILSLNCKTIFISRHDTGSLNLTRLRLSSISNDNELLQLFLHYMGSTDDLYSTEAAVSDEDCIREIIHLLSGHTLALELFARQISCSFLTLPEALGLLRKQGLLHISTDRVDYQRDDRICYEQMESIITRLFQTDLLTPSQISILKALVLFPAPGIPARELMRLTGLESAEPIQSLIRMGWITRDHDRLFLHPLIRDVIQNIPGTNDNLESTLQIINTLYIDIMSESHLEDLCIDPKSISPELADILSKTDPYTIVTDHRKLLASVMTARGVLDILMNNELWGREPVQKLLHAMVTNLPKSEDEAILHYGKMLLDHPEHLSPLDVIRVTEVVNKVLCQYQEYDTALQLAGSAEKYAEDDLTKAEYYGLLTDIYDTRDFPGDREKLAELTDIIIDHSRKAPKQKREHLLAEYLLGKMNAIARRGFSDPDEFDQLFNEIRQILETECLPYSTIRHGFAITMGFYWAEAEQNQEEAEKWIAEAKIVGEKIYPQGLDYIDFVIIPPAIIYIDLQDYTSCERTLREGIRICDEHADVTAYLRKKHDLQRYLLDVFLEGKNYDNAREMITILDRECREYGFPDTVQPEVREFLG
ncbi:MAG: hypothetical protein II969_07775 [Anaerolineaceae bacterium]|nr:hypothetical protein [Anaerolineaceae bacterium]